MIIDTTYLLPIARIDVKRDLLKAIVEGRAKIGIALEDVKISLISLFELQAKACKLGVPAEFVVKAIDVISRTFNVVPFHRRDVIKASFDIYGYVRDYVDSVIIATAIALREDLVTEDSLIHSMEEYVSRNYGIRILSYKDIVAD